MRERNEDQFLVAGINRNLSFARTSLLDAECLALSGRTQGYVFAVADGMGGVAGGEQASRIAVCAIGRYVLDTMPWFFRLDEGRPDDFQDELAAALRIAARNIEAVAARRPEVHGMGTTVTLAYVLWPRLYVAHAGDSRCYIHREGRLSQVTTDHTWAQRLVEEGVPRDQVNPRFGHALWNVVGGSSGQLEPEGHRIDLRVGDTLVLSTDGLAVHVTDDGIGALLAGGLGAEETCRRLVDAANAGGGSDNITVVVARFLPPGAIPAGRGPAVA